MKPFTPIYVDPLSKQLVEKIKRFAPQSDSVLITGPTGVGKESAARLLHEHGGRRGQFVAVDCGAIAKHLLEAQLFGTVKGAFTGAENQDGYLTQADGGTLFLDEIGNLSLENQAKLLRALDGYPYTPVGSSKTKLVNVRFVSATNADLEQMCVAGTFREDLYARIAMLPLVIPALRDRPADVPALARMFAKERRPEDTAFANKAARVAARLTEHQDSWPLGIRAVQQFVAYASVEDVGVDEAERYIRGLWQRRAGTAPQPAQVTVQRERPKNGDEHALAALIQSRLRTKNGKRLQLSTPKGSLAVAKILLDDTPTTITDIKHALASDRTRTVHKNLAPLCECQLVEVIGDRVEVMWPPVQIRFLHRPMDDTWSAVPPGYIPIGYSGEPARLEVRAMLAIHLRVVVVSHRGGEVTFNEILAREIAGRQKRVIEFTLDHEPAFEQILVHLSWPTMRGVTNVTLTDEDMDLPSPEQMQRQRTAFLERAGPGWMQEYLVHHMP